MTGRLAALCVFLAVVAPTGAAAQPSGPQEVAFAVARPAIVAVEVRWHGWVRDRRTGEVFGGTTGYDLTVTCGGAVINPDGYVATASHCVHTGSDGGGGALFDAAIAELSKAGRIGDPAKARQAFAEHGVAEGATPDSLVDREIQVRMGSDVAPATVANLVTPADGDVAVLKVPRDRLPTMRIRPDPAPVGTPVLALGYPGSAHDGRISAQGRPFAEFNADSEVQSGGPLVDLQGRLVGVISRPGRASGSEILSTVLRDKDISAAQGVHDRNYQRGLDRYFAGDADKAVEYFDAVLAAAPAHQPAAEFRRLAIEQGGSAGAGTTLRVVIAIACAGIAVAAASFGAAARIAARRNRTLTTADTPPFGIPLPQPPELPTTPHAHPGNSAAGNGDSRG